MRKLFKPFVIIVGLIAIATHANAAFNDIQNDAESNDLYTMIENGEIQLSESEVQAFLITGLGTLVKDLGGQLIKAALSKGKEDGKVQAPGAPALPENPEAMAPIEIPEGK